MLSRLNRAKYKLVEIEELIWVNVSARRTQSLRSCPALLVLRGRDLRTGETLVIHSSMSSTCSPISISISAAACHSVASCSAFGNRFYQSADAQNAHYPFHVVGQDVQGHFGTDVLGRLHLEVSGSHPGFYRAKGMFHGLAAFAHLIRAPIEPRLHSLEDGFVLPS
jgi:hypothetical protein